MREALLFTNGVQTLVSALDVKNGVIGRDSEFIDPEYEFKVIYVCASRGHGDPYFRLYMSREDYKRLTPEQKDRYEILAEMRHYQETPWHREWKERLKGFCHIEKSLFDEKTGKRRIADAYYEEKETVIELQHSYIAQDFEERNEHYGSLGLNTVWLYDLPGASLKAVGDNEYEILEDNAKGFFRIAENPESLRNYPIFIQPRDQRIYLVKELNRRHIDGELKSTIRFFHTAAIYSVDEFIQGLKKLGPNFVSTPYANKNGEEAQTIYELWRSSYRKLIVRDTITGDIISIISDRNKPEGINRDFQTNDIAYRYMAQTSPGKYSLKSVKFYNLSEKKAHEKRWICCAYYNK